MVINGQGKPKILITDVTHGVNNPLEVISLPFCEKLTENWNPITTRHVVQKGKLAKREGWEYKATLDYRSFLDGQVLLDMAAAFDAHTAVQNRMLVLMPREDVPMLHYNVIFSNSFDISLIRDEGHGDIVFEFEGLDNEPTVPTEATGYGSFYGSENGGDGYGQEL